MPFKKDYQTNFRFISCKYFNGINKRKSFQTLSTAFTKSGSKHSQQQKAFFILMNGLSRRDEKMYYRHKFDPLLGELLHLTANMKHDTVFQNEDNLWDRTLYNNY